MTLAFIVYLIGALEGIITASIATLFLAGAGTVIAIISHFIIRSEYRGDEAAVSAAEAKNYAVRFLWVFVAAAAVAIIVPKEKTAYMMAGAYATQRIYESPETAKLQGKVLAILNDKLDTYMPKEKTKPETKKEVE